MLTGGQNKVYLFYFYFFCQSLWETEFSSSSLSSFPPVVNVAPPRPPRAAPVLADFCLAAVVPLKRLTSRSGRGRRSSQLRTLVFNGCFCSRSETASRSPLWTCLLPRAPSGATRPSWSQSPVRRAGSEFLQAEGAEWRCEVTSASYFAEVLLLGSLSHNNVFYCPPCCRSSLLFTFYLLLWLIN